MPAFVGTSGWQYADWKRTFHPADLPPRCWLGHYPERFSTVEVNHAFSTYRLLERSVFESWEARTPAGFVVAVEARRYLTHLKRLRDDTHAWAPRGAVPFVRLLAQAGMTTALGQGRAAS